MNEQLTNIFKNKYKSIDTSNQWKGFLKSLFKSKESSFYNSPLEKKEDKNAHEDVDSILEFGDLILDDGSRILFYEVKLKDNKQVTSRVALRNIIHSNVIPGDVDGIIATYYNPTSNDWRLTFISKSLYWDDEYNEIKEETHPKRYTYVLGEGESIKTALIQFEWLFNEVRNREITIEDIIKTFSVEKISNEFFTGYFNQFIAFSEYITENENAFSFFKKQVDKNKTDKEQQEDAERLVRHFVKKLLGRIVFLYFLQKKGWLGVAVDKKWGEGQKDFMSQLFNNCDKKKKYYNNILTPLFFKALNVDRRGDLNDVFPITNTRVPYLNGGLFEKDKIEPDTLQIKPLLFEELFNFFDQYNFTIDENSPDDKDIGIDPEMLGLIFENLLEDNKDKGTFYTPKEVVHYMCKESLCSYLLEELKSKCSKEELHEIKTLVFENDKIDLKVISQYASDLDKALSTVKICDPAIGSGAFPMGMVYEIFRIKRFISSYLDVKDFIYLKEKLKIIRHSIYGVDIDKGAVDIARLRFWLSLIVDEQEPQPLPNLDYKIMQGDSLKESFEGIPLDTIMDDEAPKQEQQFTLGDEFKEPQATYSLSFEEKSNIKYWVDQYFSLEPLIKKQELHDKIDKAVINHINKNVTASAKDLKKQLLQLELKYANAGKNIALLKSGRDVKLYKTLKAKTDAIDAQEKYLLKIQESTERPYFLWNLFFDKVLNEGNKGFDIVIGNPPYGGIKIDDEVRKTFGVVSKDPYGAFMSMAIKKLLKPNGVLCYIVSDTWLTIKSHKPLREIVLQHQLKNVIRLHQDCFKATVNSCIFTLIKNSVTSSAVEKPQSNNQVIAADLTNISTRKQIPEFREKLRNLNKYIGQYTPEFAVYSYKQNLISKNSCIPIFTASPDIFKNTFESETKLLSTHHYIDEMCGGVKSYGDKLYIKNRFGHMGYPKIMDSEIVERELTQDEKENGINESDKIYLKYDKGGETINNNTGFFNSYIKPIEFYFKWDSTTVEKLKKNNGLRNKHRYFSEGIGVSTVGVYAPIFRYSKFDLFFNNYNIIFPKKNVDYFTLLGLFNSKLYRYLLDCFDNHTVAKNQIDILNVKLPLFKNEIKQLSILVKSIVEKLKKNVDYLFVLNEQKEIDTLVYALYGLNAEDINEVETWFARRYPKLAKYAFYKSPEELLQTQIAQTNANDKILQLIANGESKTVEFKSTLRFCLKQNSPQKYVEHTAIKNLAAFLNTEGGTLFIGVDDDGNVLGLENTDFPTFSDTNKKDGFSKHFDNLIQNYFGNNMAHKFDIEYAVIDTKTIAIVHIKDKANAPVIIVNKEKNNKEEFYIRRNASAITLTMFEMLKYTKDNWE